MPWKKGQFCSKKDQLTRSAFSSKINFDGNTIRSYLHRIGIINIDKDYIAPCSAFHSWWQSKDLAKFSEFFRALEDSWAEKLLLNFVDLDTELSQFLISKLLERNIRPEFILSEDKFLSNVLAIRNALEQGVHFAILISKPIEPLLVKKIEEFRDEFKEEFTSFKFIIIGRRDWNALITYRSIPFFMRKALYIDCPSSLYSNDAFYSKTQREVFLKKLNSFFPNAQTQSYCPNIRCYADWGKYSSNGENPHDELPYTITRGELNVLSWEKFGQDKISIENITPEQKLDNILAEKQEFILQKRDEARYRQDQRKELYWNIYRSTPKVALEGHLLQVRLAFYSIYKYLTYQSVKVYYMGVKLFWFLRHQLLSFLQVFVQLFWFLRHQLNCFFQVFVQFYWFLHKYTLQLYFYLYWFIRHHSINSAVQTFWFLRTTVLSIFWGLYPHLLKFYHNLKSSFIYIYWFFYKVAFPIRKIYYMLEYEYEKRILGLHKEKKGK